MTVLSDRFGAALMFAERSHRQQTRKGSGIPYIAHLLAVTALVLEYGGTEDQAIAALLHDAVEDQGGLEMAEEIRHRFGDAVAAIVCACTDSVVTPKPPWRARKEAYLAGIPAKPSAAILVILADKTHNATAIAEDRRVVGAAIWDRFTGGRTGTLWYYRALADALAARAPGPLADRLQRVVAELEAPGLEPLPAAGS